MRAIMRGPERSAGFADSTCKAFHRRTHTQGMDLKDVCCRHTMASCQAVRMLKFACLQRSKQQAKDCLLFRLCILGSEPDRDATC